MTDHISEVNWGPQSEEMSAGKSYCEIQCWMKALAQAVVSVTDNGITIDQNMNLSIIVKRWVCLWKGGKGPTMLTLMWAKRHFQMSNLAKGAFVWHWTFDCWQDRNCWALYQTCFDIPCSTNVAPTRQTAVLMAVWEKLWNTSKTVRHQVRQVGSTSCWLRT